MILVMLMTVCLLTGCGGLGGAEESEKPAAEKKITLDSGYWVLETMTMEGVEFTSEEIIEIYGELDAVMALALFGKDRGCIGGVVDAYRNCIYFER